GGDIVTVEGKEPAALGEAIAGRFGVKIQVIEGAVRFEHADGARFLPRLLEAFPDRIAAVACGKPTLEDVFIRLTGHRFWTAEERS
ncbi:MAG: ABC transporter ATP-binding protein, partial [Planctomycetes bacterium]|nr:ABC transporter ATP-binding protein [Planctomycetota bacterium]